MPSIPIRIPLIERSKHGGIYILYYKRKPVSHVSQGTVIDSLARKRSKEADGVYNIEDAYLFGGVSGGISKAVYLHKTFVLAHHSYLRAETYKLKCVERFGSILHCSSSGARTRKSSRATSTCAKREQVVWKP